MPKYTVEILASGDIQEFHSIPDVLRYINENRAKKGQRNIGPKGLKKILASNGVFENVLRIRKSLKGGKKSAKAAQEKAEDAMDVDISGSGAERPEKPLPFKTRRSIRKAASAAPQGGMDSKRVSLQTEETKCLSKESGLKEPPKGKPVEIGEEKPQVKKIQPKSKARQLGLARGRLAQKLRAIAKSIQSQTGVDVNTRLQNYFSLKKTLEGLSKADLNRAADTAAKKLNVESGVVLLKMLQENLKETERLTNVEVKLELMEEAQDRVSQDVPMDAGLSRPKEEPEFETTNPMGESEGMKPEAAEESKQDPKVATAELIDKISPVLKPFIVISIENSNKLRENITGREERIFKGLRFRTAVPDAKQKAKEAIDEFVQANEELVEDAFGEGSASRIVGMSGSGMCGGADEDAMDQDAGDTSDSMEADAVEDAMPMDAPMVSPDEPDYEKLYPLNVSALQNLGNNAIKDYHDLRIMLNTVKDVPTFLNTLRSFSIKAFKRPQVSNALQASIVEVAGSYAGEPQMYAKYIVHLAYFILKNKIKLNADELLKIQMGLSQKYQQFFGMQGEVEDNSITSHIRLMVNEAAGASISDEPMVQQELIQGAGQLDSVEMGLKEIVRTTDNMQAEQEVVARRRMHKSKRRGMVLFEPGKSNLSTQARLAPFKTPIDPELRRPISEHLAPTQRVTRTPRVSVVTPGAPQRVSVPQVPPVLTGDERPVAFTGVDGAEKDLKRAQNLNTRNKITTELARILGTDGVRLTQEDGLGQMIPGQEQPVEGPPGEEEVKEGDDMSGSGAMNQTELRRRRGITLFNNDAHERRAHKRLRASFTLNMFNEV